jgi:hypothetical protein
MAKPKLPDWYVAQQKATQPPTSFKFAEDAVRGFTEDPDPEAPEPTEEDNPERQPDGLNDPIGNPPVDLTREETRAAAAEAAETEPADPEPTGEDD